MNELLVEFHNGRRSLSKDDGRVEINIPTDENYFTLQVLNFRGTSGGGDRAMDELCWMKLNGNTHSLNEHSFYSPFTALIALINP